MVQPLFDQIPLLSSQNPHKYEPQSSDVCKGQTTYNPQSNGGLQEYVMVIISIKKRYYVPILPFLCALKGILQ